MRRWNPNIMAGRLAVCGPVIGCLMVGCLIACGLALTPATANGQDPIDDWFELEIDGSTVTVHHNAAFYNCCYETMHYDLSVEGDVLTLVETEDLGNLGCYCLCYYDLTVVIEDVPPGAWTLVFVWLDFDGWRQVELPFTIEDGDPGTLPEIAAAVGSECYDDATAVPDEPVDPLPERWSWSSVKACYE